jgi:uncharacterized membrane protein
MTMIFVWQWIDGYFILTLTGEINVNPLMFRSVLIESLILAILGWIFQRLLRITHVHSGQKWFVKKIYVRFFKILFYFLLFLLFFWITAFYMLKVQPFTSLEAKDSVMIAAALSLLISGIPAIVYMIRSSGDYQKSHLHVHRHSRHRKGQ